ncbi:hypothetical protein Acr_16g0008860 [Actinidia rufa]|uniref:Uncharacterized protein n=1 Tax=Actinidia rufa TaxID=165716 RepID=A0A7J0FZY9_9ERIC|nr:hypothetical protein Acr_16g0008860 [Actinidia rufa]
MFCDLNGLGKRASSNWVVVLIGWGWTTRWTELGFRLKWAELDFAEGVQLESGWKWAASGNMPERFGLGLFIGRFGLDFGVTTPEPDPIDGRVGSIRQCHSPILSTITIPTLLSPATTNPPSPPNFRFKMVTTRVEASRRGWGYGVDGRGWVCVAKGGGRGWEGSRVQLLKDKKVRWIRGRSGEVRADGKFGILTV